MSTSAHPPGTGLTDDDTARMRRLRCAGLAALLLAAAGCGQETPSGTGVPPGADDAAPAAQSPRTETAPAEPAVEHPEVAIDEPLPPFEDDSGIVLASRSVLAATAGAAIAGEVLLYQAPDGSRLLRLENLQTPRERRFDLALSRADGGPPLRVGALKGPSGNMNYLLDAGLDLAQVRAIVLVEPQAGSVQASAPLTPP